MIAAGRLPAVRGRAARVRDRGRRRDGRGEPERAAEDARGAAAVRAPDPGQRRARGAAGDGPLALSRPCASARSAPRRSRRGSAEPARRGAERTAAARLAAGDPERARFLLGEDGRDLRAAAERLARRRSRGRPRRRAVGGDRARRPRRRPSIAPRRCETRAAEAEEEAADRSPAAVRRRAREAEDAAAARGRRARTETARPRPRLLGAWVRDLAAVADGAAPSSALNSDHADELARARRGARRPARAARRRARARHAPAPAGQRLRGAGPGGARVSPGIPAARDRRR